MGEPGTTIDEALEREAVITAVAVGAACLLILYFALAKKVDGSALKKEFSISSERSHSGRCASAVSRARCLSFESNIGRAAPPSAYHQLVPVASPL